VGEVTIVVVLAENHAATIALQNRGGT